MDIDLEIKGLAETQARLKQLLQDTSERGGMEAVISKATFRAERYAAMVTHVLTGRLKNSLFPRIHTGLNEVYGVIGTNVVYAMVEHERGGEHAFFQRTVDEEGPAIQQMMESDIARYVERAGG